MKTSFIQAGSPYRGAALHECHVSQSCGKSLRSCNIHHGNFFVAINLPQFVDFGTPTSACKLSAYRPVKPHTAVGIRRPKRSTNGKDLGKFGSRFGELSGGCCQASIGVPGNSSYKKQQGIRASLDAGANGGDESRGEGEDVGSSSVWDLPARHKRIQAAAAKVGDPFRDMMTNASKKLQDYLDNIKSSRTKEKHGEQEKPETDWDRWQKVFTDAEERDNLASVLKFQLEEAVDNEDFQEAAVLKEALAAVSAGDTVSEIMKELKSALAEERYDAAARLRDKAGAGLVGWWVGLAEAQNDPYGRIIHISAAQGRFLAKSYSARQLATAASGIPLFEVFVTRDGDNNYKQQAVYLQREGNVSPDTLLGPTSKEIDISELIVNEKNKDLKTRDVPGSITDDNEEKSKDPDFIDEGLNNILSFLKERMPDVKLKVFQVIAPEGLEADIPKIVEQLRAEGTDDANSDVDTDSVSEDTTLDPPEDEKFPAGSNNIEEQETPIRLVVGGVLQNSVDEKAPKVPVRVPAKIERKTRDSFLFNIDEVGMPSGSTSTSTSAKEPLPHFKMAAIATQASADLMPDDVAKVFWNSEKAPVKVSKEMGEIIRLAVTQAQRRRGLSKSTSFRRINVSEAGSDPLSGLYIGAFGPYTSEVVQLRRKFGQWQEDGSADGSTDFDKLEFFEYVEAVKLTGDLNVPAGQVTFRAKIGRESRLSLRGAYPEELGVVGRYKGQGRLAEPGFRNPQWIDGELVLLDGKGGGHTNGAELGFVYSVPERHFLVLFNRLKLQE
ncbi:hypothetical protein MPTK1_3g00210 [Marchantia polymorpha subsp. ruderalis]|uniref:UVR domain-containing protein n=2 Tax=Marchantia polymorpha TaxID=3197 RepID=A0AAF6AVT6_MARPO|nr:hypothetical protein MARPO_0007s0019 [Marchantia polymorpha]PTQ47560.1 hypothetical protein MARPO_0007s0019 [Marchantia polymorpha]BBN03869.1 hypothetical protein Mp_3g00210 [Marchantia polymorpha subsp. ruderalis]BBN03870.1 hypothetical protein Mp_3g00210 [Marchantia polymorpha subsp. ruderalis]|eukprot:PTQ47559.1 hypothetical protein MARPO_0007s0019 [Marchantia polymorpha]